MAVLLKCNALQIPPKESFVITLPISRDINLEDNEEVFVWKSETPRQGPLGKGLEARGYLVAWQRSGGSATLHVQLKQHLPAPCLRMDDLALLGTRFEAAESLYSRIHRFRHPRIWSLSPSEGEILDDIFRNSQLSREIAFLADIDRVNNDPTVDETTRKALIDARIGQGQFRKNLIHRWGNACAVSGCSLASVLRASHIKPWRSSTTIERLDPANGLLLAAHLDALFDAGLISFAENGEMLMSKLISAKEARLLRIPAPLRMTLSMAENRFLSHHRIGVFIA